MTLMKRNSFLPGFPQFFDDFFTKEFFDWGTRNQALTNMTLPSVNVIEDNEGFTVEMAAPGMSKKDFKIELDNEALTISSEKEVEKEIGEDQRYTRREFSYQAFSRTFHLPKSVVDDAKIKAKYDDGILRVMIPKKEEAKSLPPRKIAIS